MTSEAIILLHMIFGEHMYTFLLGMYLEMGLLAQGYT